MCQQSCNHVMWRRADSRSDSRAPAPAVRAQGKFTGSLLTDSVGCCISRAARDVARSAVCIDGKSFRR